MVTKSLAYQLYPTQSNLKTINRGGANILAPPWQNRKEVSSGTPLFVFFWLEHCRARLGDFFVLLRALRSTATNRADDLAVVDNRHSALQRREIGERGHRETALVDRVLEVLRGFLENRGRASFSDGNIRASGKAFFGPDEVEQVTAVVHDRDGWASAAVFREFRVSFANLLCTCKRKLELVGDVTLISVVVGQGERRGHEERKEREWRFHGVICVSG